MSKLEWQNPRDQTFEAGLDRGVLYVEDGPAVSWNGLTTVDDDGEAEVKEFYIDGVKYLSVVSPRDWKGKLSAYTYPEEFAELIGIAELGDGLYVDSQAPGRFGLSYRTMISTPGIKETPDYKIHLIYKAMASLQSFSNQTLSDKLNPSEFEFELSAVPIQIPDARPSAHVILDTRKMDAATLASLESILYGDADQDPALPTIEELTTLLKFSDAVTVVSNGDGTWTATGSNDNIQMLDNQGFFFEIDNVNAVYDTPDIYRFPDLDTTVAMSVMLDDDDIPYVASNSDEDTNVGTDDDGQPYFQDNEDDMFLLVDDDGAYYVEDDPADEIDD